MGALAPRTETDLVKARNDTKIGGHPDRLLIEALLRRGRTPYWIAGWLEERYPDTEEDEESGEIVDAPDAAAMRKLQIAEETIERYRDDWMPEVSPGVDTVFEDIEEIVGRHFPGSERGPEHELDLMDMLINVGQHTLAQALASDAEMEMVQSTTLDAAKMLQGFVKESVEIKQNLGRPGYEAQPEQIEINSTNRNISVELHGRLGKNGERSPNDRALIDGALALLQAPTDEALAALHAVKASQEPVIEGREAPEEAATDA
jgi:hypothetical protein